ncbi:Hypothetical protein FKW44_000665 [Caligus rogercresseyi]|uniref:Uncharacterized protein n=1 Tax=Caligus rogercresseyi TaxID=217165 RepID=A0A7T8KHX8_CALRO|nr:Hypothetical protein FKW44_000665 [Caligus rogercresseyi]
MKTSGGHRSLFCCSAHRSSAHFGQLIRSRSFAHFLSTAVPLTSFRSSAQVGGIGPLTNF